MKILSESKIQAEDTSAARLQCTDAGRERFLSPGFGVSVHWGLYGHRQFSGNEWCYWEQRIPLEIYRTRMDAFRAPRFDAEEWGDLLLEAGASFFMITTKHHDGFCLFETDSTDFTLMHTPFGRDPIAELASALRDRGIALHFYYSLLDWTRPSYRNDWPAYVAYYQGHLRELLTRYGPIGGVLFDGDWPRTSDYSPEEHAWFAPKGPWRLAETYDLIHELQPDAMVVDNSHIRPRPGEDYQIYELDFPGQRRMSFQAEHQGTKPCAVWWNLNGSWGYQPYEHNLKEAETLLEEMAGARRHGAEVFILNVGPRPWGDTHPDEAATLRRIGTLRRRYGLRGIGNNVAQT
jgi:alpha-L-fucosidase